MSLQQFWDQYVISPKERYRLTGTLIGHGAAINCLAFLQHDVLASGGDDQTIRIWDVQSQKISQTFDDPHKRWGQITCMAVSDASITGGTIVCCGTGRGLVVIVKQSKKKHEFQKISTPKVFDADSVESIAYDPVHHRLACTSHTGKIKLHQLERDGSLVGLWCANSDGSIPRTVVFGDKGQQVRVYCLESGEYIARDCETGVKKDTHKLQSPIGNLDICLQAKKIIVDNMTSGYDLYSINKFSPTRSFEIPNGRRYVKMVKFAENGGVIVGGSDHGCVYVFNINDSEPTQVLCHERVDSMIQTIATVSSRKEEIIASGSSDGRFGICLWRKPSKLEAARPAGAWQTLCEFVRGGAAVLFVAGLYMSWMHSASWVPVVANGLQSVQDGFRGPQASAPYTQGMEYPIATGPWSANEISRGRMEELHGATSVALPPAQLKGKHDVPANE